MPERGGPNLARRRRLAAELRRIREDAGFTGDEATERLGWPSSSKLSRIELGRTGLKQPDLESLLDLYSVTGAHRGELIALAEESRRAGLAQASKHLPSEHITIAEDEADTESIGMWASQVVPGLLQVESYTRALLGAWVTMFSLPPGEVERRIEARRLRQQVLTRKPAPPLLTVVIDESVLDRRIGDASTMREQLQHMATLSELPHIDIRILPLDVEHVAGSGPFNYLRFRRIHAISRADVVAVEHLTGTQYLEDETDTHQYSVVFESLLEHALDEQASRELLGVAVNRWSS